MNILKKCPILLAGGLSAIFLTPLYAASNGNIDGRVHQFAGYLGIPNEAQAVADKCVSDVIYFSCGAYLIDPTTIGLPATLNRRILLTAGHCVIPRDNAKPFIVHFQDGDARATGDTGCPTRVVGFKKSGFTYYTASNSWSLFEGKSNGVGVGSGKGDYAVVLLDKPVAVADVDIPAKVAYTPVPKTLTPKVIPLLGMAGFGIAGFGDPNQLNGNGQPLVINGPREKMYVEMPTRATQDWNISSSMNATQADQTACNGDSGSALFLPAPDPSGAYTAYAHVANGDYHCRATNTSTRVDTPEFRNYVSSIAQEIKDAAGVK